MYVMSVNVGRPRPDPSNPTATTGIDKIAVDHVVQVSAPGPKGTGEVGLAGDRAFDVRHHGGADQAVYAYAREDLDRWEAELGRALSNGSFGENLTTSGVDVSGARIGERWRIGTDLVLEISCPRIPCATFAAWIEVEGWIDAFTTAADPGAYLRVVHPGAVRAGDPVVVESRPHHDVTVTMCFRALTREPDLLPRLLVADALPAETRERVARRQRA